MAFSHVGPIRRFPVLEGDEVVARHVIQLWLPTDHRVYSGANSAGFLAAVRSRLEQPLGLLW